MLSLKYLVLLFTFYGAIDGKQFRCDYTYFSKVDGFLKLHRIPANWAEARLRCHLEGSKLASPLNNELASVMRSMMDQNDTKCGVYTGIHSFFSKGDFHSIEGIPLSKIPHMWAKGEPDNFNDEERCTVMLGSGELADVNCSEPLPYLCYRTSTGLRASLGDCGTVDIKYNFESRTGSCYKFHKVARTWSRAYMTCAAEGGHLAIINSDTEAQIIKEIYAWFPDNARVGNFRTDMAYIGFHDWGEHSSVEFLTVDGQTLEQAGYAKFESTEPSNSTTGQYCGAVNRRAELFDLWCEDARWFICEKSPDSLLCDDQTQPTAGY